MVHATVLPPPYVIFISADDPYQIQLLFSFRDNGESVELIAVQVAEITCIESIAAESRRAFVFAAEFQRFGIHFVHLLGGPFRSGSLDTPHQGRG